MPEAKQRIRLSPAEFYSAERVVSLGEVDTKKDPKLWTGWDDHWLRTGTREEAQGITAIFGVMRKYKGRILLWRLVRDDPSSICYYTVIRWDEKSEKHFFIGHYKNYGDALQVLGITPQYKWLQVARDRFVLKRH